MYLFENFSICLPQVFDKMMKKFGHSTTSTSAATPFISKLWEGLAPRIVAIFSPKFFWGGSRPITVTPWQEFEIPLKKWHF